VTGDFDWPAAVDEVMRELDEAPLSGYPKWTNDNRVAWLADTEMLDQLRVTREINRRMTEAFLEATATAADSALGDLDNWKPVGILNRVKIAELFDVPPEMVVEKPKPPRVFGPPPGFVESAMWTALWEEVARQWSKAEFEMGRDDRNARAVEWWRSQRVDKPRRRWSTN
jgi:hypothetical protein